MITYYLIYFFIALWIVKGLYNWIHAIILRLAMVQSIKKICKKRGFTLVKTRPIFASLFRFSPKPDMIVKTGGADYVLRVVTCRARKRIYHFVSHEWFVWVFKLLCFCRSCRTSRSCFIRRLNISRRSTKNT